MRAEKLLKIQESNLNVGGRFKQIAEFLIENENATVVWVLETVSLYVFVDRTSYGTTGNELTFRQTEECTKLLGNLLFAIEPVVLSPLGRFLSVRIVELSLDLSYKLGQRLKFATKRSNLFKAFSGFAGGFSRHCILYMQFIFKYICVKNVDVY
jgi:hypothetical protein